MADKEEIRSRSDILEVIQAFVPLKRRGRNYVGLCPFHAEKTGSFNVDPQMQTYKCFGCGEFGDVFKFVQKYENLGFVEAAEFLARRVGLTFDRGPADAAKASERDQLFEVNRIASDWFQKSLDRAAMAREYLRSRGLAHETIRRFQIGFAPDDWEGLTNFLRTQRRDLRVAEKAGLIKKREDGSYFDMFRARTIFPILDEQERIVGFGARAMGDEQPKYLNTGETPLFNKSKILYGLPYARRRIAADGKILLMEGYMDVIAAHQAGFTNAVAAMGTSLTEEHAKRFARLVPENPIVVLVYDADNAGIKATLRASEILEKESIQVQVARLPAGEDPDSLLSAGHIDRFQRVVDEAIGRVEYQLERIVAKADQTTDAGHALMLRQIVAILASVPSRSERDIYVEKVWRYHPLSSQGPRTAKEQLHLDAEAEAAKKRRGSRRPSSAQSQELVMPRSPEGQKFRETYRGSVSYRKEGSFGRRDGWRERPRPIEPVPISAGIAPVEERAEQSLMRALAQSEWRETVLKAIREEELVTDIGRRFFRFVRENASLLGDDPAQMSRLLMAVEDESFSSLILQRLQESNAQLTNDPITEQGIRESAEIARRRHQISGLQAELDQLMQSEKKLTREEHDRISELTRAITQLKSLRPC